MAYVTEEECQNIKFTEVRILVEVITRIKSDENEVKTTSQLKF